MKARIAASVAAVLVLLYVVLSLAYVLPPGNIKSALGGYAALGRPYFSQSWNVFAPNILKANIELEFQAQWYDANGELISSEWISATDLETASVAGWPVPSRIVKQSWNLIKSYNSRFLELNADQRDVVRDTFIRSVDGKFTTLSFDGIVAKLNDLGDNPGDVLRLARYDALMKEYVTYLATAYLGEDIARVRWRMFTERPNDFEHRNEPEMQFEPDIRQFGWRLATERILPEVLAVYEEVVRRGGGGADVD